MIQGET